MIKIEIKKELEFSDHIPLSLKITTQEIIKSVQLKYTLSDCPVVTDNSYPSQIW